MFSEQVCGTGSRNGKLTRGAPNGSLWIAFLVSEILVHQWHGRGAGGCASKGSAWTGLGKMFLALTLFHGESNAFLKAFDWFLVKGRSSKFQRSPVSSCWIRAAGGLFISGKHVNEFFDAVNLFKQIPILIINENHKWFLGVTCKRSNHKRNHWFKLGW